MSSFLEKVRVDCPESGLCAVARALIIRFGRDIEDRCFTIIMMELII
jgi:hypothetical protein